MKKLIKVSTIMIALTILGCSSSGEIKKIQDRDIVSTIKIGVTSQKEVYQLFGEPTYRGTKPVGETWWAYYYASGAGQGSSLSIDFDETGRVKTYNYIP